MEVFAEPAGSVVAAVTVGVGQIAWLTSALPVGLGFEGSIVASNLEGA